MEPRSLRAASACAAFLLAVAGSPLAITPVVPDPMMPFSSWIGGSGGDRANAVAVATDGTVWIAGGTGSWDFPDPGVADPSRGATFDAVVLRFDPARREIASTVFFEGSGREEVTDIAVDAEGNALVCGRTDSPDFPVVNAAPPAVGGDRDVFVAKVAPDGQTVLWATRIGGSGQESPGGIAADGSGRVLLCGYTDSTDFPVLGALQPALRGPSDAFVAALSSSDGGLVFSTFLGGGSWDDGEGIAVAPDGGILVCGSAAGDAFVARLAPAGDRVDWSRTLAGAESDVAREVAITSGGSVVVLGDTRSEDFPATPGPAGMPAYWASDLFLARFDGSDGTFLGSLLWGGGLHEWTTGLSLAADGTAWVTGTTGSQDLPTVGSVRCRMGGGGGDAFVAGFDLAAGRLLLSTYLGGSSHESAGGIAVDSDGSLWIAGATGSEDFPEKAPLQAPETFYGDMFLTRLSRTDPARRPAMPDGLEVEPPDGHSMELRWEDRSGNETGFAVDRAEDAVGYRRTFRRIAVLPPATTGWVDRTVLPARTYRYSVQAFNADGGSSPSNDAVGTTPSTLEILYARASARWNSWLGELSEFRIGGALVLRAIPEGPLPDPRTEGIQVEILEDHEEDPDELDYSVFVRILPGDPDWWEVRNRIRWRPWWTERPDYGVELNLKTGRFRVRMPLQFGTPGVRITIGRDAGRARFPLRVKGARIPWIEGD